MIILHTGDWHIGDFTGPFLSDGRNARAVDTLNRIDMFIDKARTMMPDMIVIAGDVFHAARTWSERGIREVDDAATRISALAEIAPVVIIRGTPNHDGAQHFEMLKSIYRYSKSVKIFTMPGNHVVETRCGELVNICALPGFDKGYWRARQSVVMDREDENKVFTDAINTLALGMKAECKPNIPSILVGHYTVQGANTESGQTMFFSAFEPIVTIDTLTIAGYDLSLFGHIHKPQVLDCPNAYYCGSINSMNFNDEGQSRGFYFHQILATEDGFDVHTHFEHIEPRVFQTIRLHDADIESIGRGAMPECDVRDAIVRVLYSCTDEHNRAFNKSILEKTLYDDGAFYVQEITPEEIVVTVNKNTMSNESDPYSNLETFLVDTDIDEDHREKALELGRPIIDSVIAANRADKPQGVFVPVEIDVTNYRNYRHERFDFTGIRFCTINGNNGVGKSSLFMDAIYDALYEDPREGDLTGWICNDTEAKSGAIRFTFRVGDRMWRVSRTRMKSGKATLNLSEYVDGTWVDRSHEKARDTQAEIEHVIGMDELTLKSCALIMQDQYGLFLQADKESRMKILGGILGLEVYEQMEAVASDKLTQSNRALRAVHDHIDLSVSRMPDAERVKADIKKIEAQNQNDKLVADTTNARISEISARLMGMDAARNRADALEAELASLSNRVKSMEHEAMTLKNAIDGVDTMIARSDEIREGLAQRATAIANRDKLSAVPASRDKMTATAKGYRHTCAAHEATKRSLLSQRVDYTSMINDCDISLAREHDLKSAYDSLPNAEKTVDNLRIASREDRRIREQMTRLRTNIDAYAENQRSLCRERRNTIASLQTRAKLLETSSCPLEDSATCVFLADAIKAKASIPALVDDDERLVSEVKRKLAEMNKELDDLSEEYSKLNFDQSKLDQAENNVRELSRKAEQYKGLQSIRERRNQLESAIASINDQIQSEEQQIADLTVKAIESEQEASRLSVLCGEYATACAEIAKTEHYVELESRLKLSVERKNAATTRLASVHDEIERCKSEAANKRAAMDSERLSYNGYQSLRVELDELTAQISKYNDLLMNRAGQIGRLKAVLDEHAALTKELRELKAEADRIAITASAYETLRKAFGQNGIPHNVIRSVIPMLEAVSSNILSQMSGGGMSVEFVTEKVTKTKKEVTTLDIVINDIDTGRLPYLSRSGGERVKVALSVILALAEVKSASMGVQIGFRFIDEPPFLDAQGVQAYCDALEAIQRRYQDLMCMIITHDPSMKARFPQSVEVLKDGDGSHAIVS